MRIATYRRNGTPGGELALFWQDRTLASFLDGQHGWQRVLDVVDIALPFPDRIAASGGLGRILAEAEAGHIDAVTVAHLDRIARGADHLDLVICRLRAAGVHLFVAPDPTPVGDALAPAPVRCLDVTAQAVSAR